MVQVRKMDKGGQTCARSRPAGRCPHLVHCLLGMAGTKWTSSVISFVIVATVTIEIYVFNSWEKAFLSCSTSLIWLISHKQVFLIEVQNFIKALNSHQNNNGTHSILNNWRYCSTWPLTNRYCQYEFVLYDTTTVIPILLKIGINMARASKKVTDWSEESKWRRRASGDLGHAFATGYHYTIIQLLIIIIKLPKRAQ